MFAWLAAACALKVQAPQVAPPGFAGPEVAADAFVSFDGARLGLQVWAPEGPPRAVIVAVHGMSEYADAFYLAGPFFAAEGVAVYAYDQRGFGRSPEPGLWAGTDLMVRDLHAFAGAVRARHPGVPLVVLGESMGAATVMAAEAASPAPLGDRIVLVAPGVRGWSALPFYYKVPLAIAARVAGGRSVSPPRGLPIQATDNIDALVKNGRDPLFLRKTRIDALHGLIDLMQTAAETTPGARTPTLFLYGEKDQLIPKAAAEATARRLGPCGRSVLYPEGWHMLLRDLQREVVWRDVLAFIEDPAAPPPSGVGPVASGAGDGVC